MPWYIYNRQNTVIDMTDPTGGWKPLPERLYGPHPTLEDAIEWLEENSWGYKLVRYDERYWVKKRHPKWELYHFTNSSWDYRFVELPWPGKVPDGPWKVGLVNEEPLKDFPEGLMTADGCKIYVTS